MRESDWVCQEKESDLARAQVKQYIKINKLFTLTHVKELTHEGFEKKDPDYSYNPFLWKLISAKKDHIKKKKKKTKWCILEGGE